MTHTPLTSNARRRPWFLVLAGLVAALAVVTVSQMRPEAEAASTADAEGRAIQRSLDDLVRDGQYPGALAAVGGRDGRIHNYTAGVGDLKTRSKVPVDGRVRIGSNTKTFTAVTVLQLVGEGKVDLDAPIEKYLPKLIRGEGIDGRRITVRQLLQHRTGLPNYVEVIGKNGFLPFRHTYYSPRELLDLGLSRKADFAPGERWEYSNTNYVVAGLLVEKVTGRPLVEEITRRTINRIGLRETSFPNVGDQTIPGRNPRGYHRDDPRKPLTDVTRWDPSFGWAAGQMISSPSDVNRFFTALLDGRLLKPEQLKEMRTTVPSPGPIAGSRYGLGLISTPLSCGGLAWGHGGSIPGYSTTNAVTDDGRSATIALTQLPTTKAQIKQVSTALDRALCSKTARDEKG